MQTKKIEKSNGEWKKILAIETSCDETAIALVEAGGGLTGTGPRFKIFKNLIASQIKIHRPFGGVVPNLAKREHNQNLPVLLKKTLNSKFYILNSIDLIAVTVGPGLEPALWTGINFAKDLYKELRIKNKELRIIGASHLEGHLYSFLLNSQFPIPNPQLFPAVALIISGGHTILLLMKDLTHYKKLGETRDDAVGEAFDKTARLLDLPYPGGPEIEKLAERGNPDAIQFPRPMLNQKNYDFSFSGLKTAVLYYLRDSAPPLFSTGTGRSLAPAASAALDLSPRRLSASLRDQARRGSETFRTKTAATLPDIAASFQQAAFDALISKTLRAAKEFKAKSIMISGGVAANNTLRKQFQSVIASEAKQSQLKINLFVSPKKFCTDNAAMIAVAGYINYLRKKNRRLIARGNLSLG